MKVVVTGGAGFIGGNVCRALTAEFPTADVLAFDNLSTGDRANVQGSGARLVEQSILDRTALEGAVDGADTVIHLAARPSVPRSLSDPVATHEANATGTMYVLEAARRAAAYTVVASSSSVYGAGAQLPKHEDLPTRPISPYGASKLVTEAYALSYAASFGLPVLALRFFNVYGPLQPAGHAYAAVIPAFIDHALRGEPLPLYGDGEQSRDFTYVGTVTRVICDAVRRSVTSEDPVNLAFGTRTNLLELIAALERALDQPLTVEKLPARRGDIKDSQAANERLRRLFPDVEPVLLEDGLRRTLSWFQGRPSER